MQFSDSWLRHFVNPPLSNEALAHALTMAGLEVEALASVAPPCSQVVVAKVCSTAPHPNADKLKVCEVDAGQGELLQIVCGASNVRAGLKVPCALIGATLSSAQGDKPFLIKRSKLRGVESCGMLCSAQELGIPDHANEGGILGLPEDAPVGQDIRTYLGLDEQRFTIKLTPNRADCLSIMGIAREVAALTGTPVSPSANVTISPTISDILPIQVSAPTLCGRFAGRIIRQINPYAPTPRWMIQRLERAGQRSLGALVDISNYVMLERGRPNHVFDINCLTGPLEVRWARPNETLELLDGTLAQLDETVGIIADAKGPQSLAGIMGGAASAVSMETTDIYLEAAFWHPDSIRGRARRYRLTSEAGHRFERGVDYAAIPEDLEYLTHLILSICGGQPGPIDDQIINLPQRPSVQLRVAQVKRILGITLVGDDIADIFRRLELPFERTSKTSANSTVDEIFTVTPPAWRFDIAIEADLIEEIARLHGFEALPLQAPKATHILRGAPETQRSFHAIRHQLAARDYHETIHFSFVDPAWEQDFSPYAAHMEPITLINPLSGFLSTMRSTLIGGLIHTLRHNLNRKADRVRLFEVGHLFLRAPEISASETHIAGFTQPQYVGGLAYGPTWTTQWGIKPNKSTAQASAPRSPADPVDFFDVKNDIEALFSPSLPRFTPAQHPALHPGRSARIDIEGKPVGWIGELHPKHLSRYDLPQAPIVFEIDAQALMARTLPCAATLSKFPPVQRDIAIIVQKALSSQALLETLNAAQKANYADAQQAQACRYIQNIQLFDVFEPRVFEPRILPQDPQTQPLSSEGSTSPTALQAGEKSLAFRITLQAEDTTLQDDMVELAMQTLLDALITHHGARQRS